MKKQDQFITFITPHSINSDSKDSAPDMRNNVQAVDKGKKLRFGAVVKNGAT